MRFFIKQNYAFIWLLMFSVVVCLFLVSAFGFWEMVSATLPMTERLRDVTFPIWDQYDVARHGFLAFLSASDFEKGVAYSNHSSAYLFLMYAFYKIEKALPWLPMRALVPILEIIFSVLVIIWILANRVKEKIAFSQGVLIILGVANFITIPGYWISAAKFNFDNIYHLYFPLLLWVGCLLSRQKHSGAAIWVPVIVFCLFAPKAGVLLGIFLFILAVNKNSPSAWRGLLGLKIISLSALVYLQPIVIAKALGFSSGNSGWIFRAGLDGDVSYFSNAFNSVFFPYFPRPTILLLVPIALLLLQLLYGKFNECCHDCEVLAKNNSDALFLGILFSSYMQYVLFWPQSVSIHPYLYDYVLLAPLAVWIILNFSASVFSRDGASLWVWIMLFVLSFNLQQIAQAKRCEGACYSPLMLKKQ